MERLGPLPSAATFRTLVAIGNRVAHVYPDDPARQAQNLNEAYAAVGDLTAAHEAARRYLEQRLHGLARGARPWRPPRAEHPALAR